MGNYAWTTGEDRILKEWYPKEGLPGAVLKLQLAGYKRTNEAVRQRAHLLKLLSPYCTANFGPGPYTPDPKFEAAFLRACSLINDGVRVCDAIRTAGIERSRYYRTRKVREGK